MTSLASVNPLYQEKLKVFVGDSTCEGLLDPKKGETLISLTERGVKFQVAVCAEEGIITQASFLGPVNEVDRALLSKLCRVVKGTTPQECSDHGPIQVEWELRNHAEPRQHKGLVTPANADPAFEIVVKFCRLVLNEYNRQTGNTETRNFFDRDQSQQWVLLSDEERLAKITEALGKSEFAEVKNLRLSKIYDEVKVDVDFGPDWTSLDKQDFLLKAEMYLRENVEGNLQLFAVEKSDANSLRHKNQ